MVVTKRGRSPEHDAVKWAVQPKDLEERAILVLKRVILVSAIAPCQASRGSGSLAGIEEHQHHGA